MRPLTKFSRSLYRIGKLGDLLRSLLRSSWLLRFKLRRFARHFFMRFTPTTLGSSGLEDLEIYYINLDSRGDRRAKVLKEFENLGVAHLRRFRAVSRTPGILGCTLSHASLVRESELSSKPFMICEDDVQFLAERGELNEVLAEFLADPSLDVLCLAYNLGSRPHIISPRLSVTNDTQTASCYVVKDSAKKQLSKTLYRGAEMLEAGYPPWVAANDIIWKRLQRSSLGFAIPNKPMAKQRQSYSDVEGRWVDYGV